MVQKKEIQLGWLYFILFAILIISGIITKRVFGYPEFMMMFHVPAAVFLILAGKKLTVKLKEKYETESQEILRRKNEEGLF